MAPALAGALAGVLAGTAAHAQVSAADSAFLVATTQRLADAITAGDSAVWAPHVSSRFLLTDEEGYQLGRDEFLRALRGLPAGQSGRLRVERTRLTGSADVAVHSYDLDEWHDFYGQELRTRFHTTDTWVREGGAWRLLATQVTALPRARVGRSVPRQVLDAYAGVYALAPEIALRLVVDDSGLVMAREGRPSERLHALDDRTFIRHGARGFWLFERDARGAVVRLVNWRDNEPVVWERR
jgi:hypothetical protein